MRAVLTPAGLEELLRLRRRHSEASILAGGTDLLTRQRAAAAPENAPLIWIGKVAALQAIRRDGDHLSIGAAVPFTRIIADPLIQHHAPLLVQAARTIGAPAIRNMATIGGNICTASPAGDSLPPLYLMGAILDLASDQGTRRIPIDRFITGPGRTALETDELLTCIRLPIADGFVTQRFEKIGRRKAMAIAVASFAGMARLSADGAIETIRLAWGSVAPTVVRLAEVENRLTGVRLNRDLILSAADLVRSGVAPIDDIRAPSQYRRSVAGNLLIRFLEELHG